jgi:MFS family permease
MKKLQKKLGIKKTTYQILLLSEIFWMFSLSILGPVYAIFVEGIVEGSLVDVGLAYTAYLFTVGILSMPLCKISEKYGKRKTIIFGCLLYIPVPFLYPSVTNIYQIFVLQIWNGISVAISDPTWGAFLAEVTHSMKRSRQYSWKHTVTHFAAGIAALVGGTISHFLGFKYTFYLVGVFSIIATSILFFIDDK